MVLMLVGYCFFVLAFETLILTTFDQSSIYRTWTWCFHVFPTGKIVYLKPCKDPQKQDVSAKRKRVLTARWFWSQKLIQTYSQNDWLEGCTSWSRNTTVEVTTWGITLTPPCFPCGSKGSNCTENPRFAAPEEV